MSEKLLTPLDVMPPALRHALETILTTYRHLDRSPSIASSSKLGKLYEDLKSLWQELQWEPWLTDLQARATRLAKQRSKRSAMVQKRLRARRQDYATNLQTRKQHLAQKTMRWEQKKQAWRNCLTGLKHDLEEKLQQQTWSSTQLVEPLLRSYASEWTNAERRIAEQKLLLQKSEASYPTDLQQHETLLRTAFGKTVLRLKQELHNSPLELARLQQLNTQRRNALPGLVATWKAAAAVREMSLREELADWNTKHRTSADELPSWLDLNASAQQVSDWRQTLTTRSQHLQQRKQHLSSSAARMSSEWQHANRKPGFSQPLSSEQHMDWLRKSKPLKDALSELCQFTKRCAMLKAELLTAGFLGPDDFPDIDAAWEGAEF